MSYRSISRTFIVLFELALAVAFVGETAGVDSSDLTPRKAKDFLGLPLPDFSLHDPNGAKVSLASLKGMPVVLEFWASWCGPCRKAMPLLQAASEKYAGMGVRFYGVSLLEENPENAVAYMKQQHYSYNLLFGDDRLFENFLVEGIPTVIVLDKTGKVSYVGIGFAEDLDQKLSGILDKVMQ
jgi:thiol-disulfide isomerase/thioredoxin